MTSQTAPALDLVAQRDLSLARLSAELPAAVELRHAIHQDPRLGGDEAGTAGLVAAALNLPTHQMTEGLWTRVGPSSGPSVVIRAELDALPIHEESSIAWRSLRPGAAHVCGHDLHTAALIAAARSVRHLDLPMAFVAAFQPREETIPSGAPDFLADNGFLANQPIAVVGVHVQPLLADGFVSAIGGPINASADNFDVVVHGRPAHGAYPHLSRDPVVAAAAVVQGLQQLVSRRVDPMHPTVVTVGRIVGGHSHNQVPAEVLLQGTMRTFSETDRVEMHQRLGDLVAAICTGYGCTATVLIDRGEPVLRNDERLAAVANQTLQECGFAIGPAVRSCGADDFSYFAERFPSLMIFAGTGEAGPGSPGLHHPRFVPDDGAVGQLARIMLSTYFAILADVQRNRRRAT